MGIVDYIAWQDGDKRRALMMVYEAIKEVLPDAEERISYGMPTFWQGRNIIHFAAMKRHIGLYPGSEAIETFKQELKPYKTSTGAIQFPLNKELPLSLIQSIASWCGKQYRKG